ncbi:MAG: UDP-N-acetylmuramoyl-L-alanyl-D-glutamate--2,6-diaminopimelate ligase [Pseudomonadota bacterium]
MDELVREGRSSPRAVPLNSLILAESLPPETGLIPSQLEFDQVLVSSVTNDSRKVTPGALFFAISGARFDARQAINQAFDNGAVAVVYEGQLDRQPPGLAIKVVDVRRALSYAAHVFHGAPSLQTTNIAVTGTSGKTSVTWILSHALHLLGVKTFHGGTLGYALLNEGDRPASELRELGNTSIDPVQVHELLAQAVQGGAKAAVCEATSQGVVHRRMRDVAWNGAIFTNLSRDHLDLHGTMQAYEAAKSELFTCDLASSPKAAPFAVINTEDQAGARIADTLSRRYPEIRLFTVSNQTATGAHYVITDLRSSARGLSYRLVSGAEEISISTCFIGNHNAYNLALAALALRALGYGANEIGAVLSRVPPVPGRLEPLVGAEIPIYIDYAHKPDALEKVLSFLKPLCAGRLITVFGCGGDRDAGKRPVMGEIAYRLSDLTIVTSDNPRSEPPERIIAEVLSGIKAPSPEKLIVESDRREAIYRAIASAAPSDIVLIAGKGHEPYQEIAGVKHPFHDLEVAAEGYRKRL